MTQQVQTKTSVIEKGQVRTCITERHKAVRVLEHLAHGLCIAVQQLGGKHGLQVLSQG